MFDTWYDKKMGEIQRKPCYLVQSLLQKIFCYLINKKNIIEFEFPTNIIVRKQWVKACIRYRE